MNAIEILAGDYAAVRNGLPFGDLPVLVAGHLRIIRHGPLAEEEAVRALLGTLRVRSGWVTTQSAHLLLQGAEPIPENAGPLLEGEFAIREGGATLQYLGAAGWLLTEYRECTPDEVGAEPVLVEERTHLGTRGGPPTWTHRVYWALQNGVPRVRAAALKHARKEEER
jgi:hypothetical protein